MDRKCVIVKIVKIVDLKVSDVGEHRLAFKSFITLWLSSMIEMCCVSVVEILFASMMAISPPLFLDF